RLGRPTAQKAGWQSGGDLQDRCGLLASRNREDEASGGDFLVVGAFGKQRVQLDTCDPEGGRGERLVGRGVRESSSCPSEVTTRRGRCHHPRVQTPSCSRGSRTLAEGF